MGTTNRAFSPNKHHDKVRSKMETRKTRHAHTMQRRYVKKVKTQGVLSIVKHYIKTAFGSLFGSLFGGGYVHDFPLAQFSTPTHSPWLKGRRTDEERADRKRRRQNRTHLKQTRGYA